MNVSAVKMKAMAFSGKHTVRPKTAADNKTLGQIKHFKYLGLELENYR